MADRDGEYDKSNNGEVVGENIVEKEGMTVNVPKIGMKFKDDKEVFEFYKKYAYEVGFPVRIRSSKKDDNGVATYVQITCCREGRRPSTCRNSLKPKPTSQTGCKARLSASSDATGVWRITQVLHEHNHRTSPSKSRLYRCNRQLNEHVKRQLEINDIAGIPLHKSFTSAVVEAGGYEKMTFIEKDCRNYIDKVRRLRLGDGDALAIQAYFSKMQAFCPGFYFNIDLDAESHLRNVFWADNRCRQAYKEFGDVVTFDTTYLVNKYDMPFAPFVGVNHHGHSTLFGCGLLSNEDTETFVWLFNTWLECMEYQAPIGIITDQDRAMQKAIEVVFPNTTHRWCLWHILKKLPEKFGNHSQKSNILSTMHNVVYDSQDSWEFEQAWISMLNTYKLHENDWLNGLFRERSRWVPCFLKTSFWAGMSTTQRSESMNAFFDEYVMSKTSLKQFVEQYERALRDKVEKEFQADFKSSSQLVPCATIYEIEKQLQGVYTISKFKEFQDELIGKMYCDVTLIEDGCFGMRYEVTQEVLIQQRMMEKKFIVIFERSNCEIICSCHLFEFRGIICRHAIIVLIKNKVKTLPEKYILRRWRKDVSRMYTRVKINYNGWILKYGQHNYDRLCQEFSKVADLVANDNAQTEELMEWIECKVRNLSICKSRQECEISRLTQQSTQAQSECVGDAGATLAVPICDPKCSKRKGAPRKLRKKGPLESTTKKAKLPIKSNKEKNMSQNDVQDMQMCNQPMHEVQFSGATPVSFSPQLMGTHYNVWNQEYHLNVMPTRRVDQQQNLEMASWLNL